MADTPERVRMKGTARVAFLAHRAEVEAELEAGWPIKAIYQKRVEALGMSYAQFARYVDSIIRGGRQSASAAATAAPAPGQQPAPAVPPQPYDPNPSPSDPTKVPDHARHEPSRSRTFTYDGNPSQDDDALIRPAVPRPRS